jgi:hypothetical protein
VVVYGRLVASWGAILMMSALCGCSSSDSSGGGTQGGQTLCTNTCTFPNDGECDDGGSSSITTLCQFGTDCGDCGNRTGNGSNGGTSGKSCAWNGNCSTMAPEGSYDCLNDDRTLVTCIDGNWETVANCGGFFQGNRTCTCKGGCGTETVVCSFAFEICGNQEYPTTP